jgi:hypothetical protein
MSPPEEEEEEEKEEGTKGDEGERRLISWAYLFSERLSDGLSSGGHEDANEPEGEALVLNDYRKT